MSRHCDAFRWTGELGAALRTIRRRAGLTQAQVAEAMGGRGRTGHVAVSRLETGKATQPTFGLVADYLRACGASFADLAPVLDAYTSQPTIASERVRAAAANLAETLPPGAGLKLTRYAAKGRVADDEKVSADVRFERLRRTARSLVLRERLEACLHVAAGRPGVSLLDFAALCAYGRAVWGALGRVRRRRRGDCADEVAAVEPRYADAGSAEQRAAVRDAVLELFGDLEQSGELDRLPGAAEAAALAGRRPIERAEKRYARDAAERVDAEQAARWTALDELAREIEKLFKEAGVDNGVRARCREVSATWWHIISHAVEGSPEREKLVAEQRDAFQSRGLDSALFDRIGELVLARFRAAGSP